MSYRPHPDVAPDDSVDGSRHTDPSETVGKLLNDHGAQRENIVPEMDRC